MRWIRSQNRLKSHNDSESQRVDAAGEWGERVRSYPGRPHEHGWIHEVGGHGPNKIYREESAEAVVQDGPNPRRCQSMKEVKQEIESRKLHEEGCPQKAAAKQQGYAGTPTHCRIQRHHCNLMSGQSAGVTLDARQFECRVTTR